MSVALEAAARGGPAVGRGAAGDEERREQGPRLPPGQKVSTESHLALCTAQTFTRCPGAVSSQALKNAPWMEEAVPEHSERPAGLPPVGEPITKRLLLGLIEGGPGDPVDMPNELVIRESS
ncbi:hypothetical protein ACFWCB_04680 [Streptomyces sp. NPDC060048]|uniref:hypothetical protein n=1 Tax=unclassified Streptomyces TaxID=2593676 RepID=UPI003676F445